MARNSLNYDYVIMNAKDWYGSGRVNLGNLIKFLLKEGRGNSVILKIKPLDKQMPYYVTSAGIGSFEGGSLVGKTKKYIVDTGMGYSSDGYAKVEGLGVILSQHLVAGTSAIRLDNGAVLNYYGEMNLSELGMFYVMK